MIQLEHLTKKYKDTTAVKDLSLTFKPGVVTGLLGPNGAGKSTTMKMIVSLVRPTSGSVLIDGKPYHELPHPIQKIGTLIDPSAVDQHLTASQHLSLIATAAKLDAGLVAGLLRRTGLETVQNKPIKEYSLGMKQRLGIAAALIGDPDTVIFDEPFNGLDVDGIKWLRKLFQSLAEEGKAVIVSSHLMSEIQAVADRIVIIGRGELLADMTMEEMNQKSLSSYTYVVTNDTEKLEKLLGQNNLLVRRQEQGLAVQGIEPKEIGQLAYKNQLVVHELSKVQPTLEELFTEITQGKADYISRGVENNDASS